MPRRKRPGNIERLKSGHYRVRLSVAGRRYQFTLPTSVRADAVDFAVKKHAELERIARRRSAAGIEGQMRISAMLDEFETESLPALARGAADAYRDSLKPIRRYFVDEREDPRLEAIQTRDIDAFLAWRRVHRLEKPQERNDEAKRQPPRPVSNRTIAKDRAVLHRIFELAVKREYVASNPVSRTDAPKVDRRDPVILTPDEYERLLGACDGRPMLMLYVLVLGETGARCESEALWLQWEDVELAEGFLWIASGREGHRTKSGKGRWVPMSERLTAAMKEHFARYRFASYNGTKTPFIFHHEMTRRHHEAGDRIVSLRSSFERAVKRAKLPTGLRQHDLRHRRVTEWLAEEKSPALVQGAMGHSDLRTTLGYAHLVKQHLKALVTPAKSANVPQDVPQQDNSGDARGGRVSEARA